MSTRITWCANCGREVTKSHGAAVAWFGSCDDCTRAAEEQMELVADRTSGTPIQLYQCRTCGTMRSCRPGWRTRCMVCLDNPTLTARKRTRYERENERMVRQELDRHTWPGWTVLATDIHGLPWEADDNPSSHGTWGRHDACGTVSKLDDARPECPRCEPEPDSRTYRARHDEPAVLYLVRYGNLQKYGIGTPARVRAHLACGAEPIQVLTARHHEVVAAERALKRLHGDAAVGDLLDMPPTFGTGTEVVPAAVPIDLHEVLPAGQRYSLD